MADKEIGRILTLIGAILGIIGAIIMIVGGLLGKDSSTVYRSLQKFMMNGLSIRHMHQ